MGGKRRVSRSDYNLVPPGDWPPPGGEIAKIDVDSLEFVGGEAIKIDVPIGKHRAEPWKNADSAYSCSACKERDHALCSEYVQWGPTDGGDCDCWTSNGDRHVRLRTEIVTEMLLHTIADYDRTCDEAVLAPVIESLLKGKHYR